jgi:hypothetical protein
MSDLELDKVLRNIEMTKTDFAKLHSLSRQTLGNRFKNGWKVGYVDGRLSMYNPVDIHEIKTDLSCDFFDLRMRKNAK